MATKTGVRSRGGQARGGQPGPSRWLARLTLFLVAAASGRAQAAEPGPPVVVDAVEARDAARADAGPALAVSSPVPPSAAEAAVRSAARVAARALPGAATPSCPPRAARSAAAIDFTPAGRTVDVWAVPFTPASRPSRLATLPRRPSSPVSAVALPGTDQVAVAVVRRTARESASPATVFLVGPGQKARVLLERVFPGGSLVATADHRVVAVRGGAVPEGAPSAGGGALRRGSFEVVTVDAAGEGGEVRSISRQPGDAPFLVGVKGNELFAFRPVRREPERPPVRQPSNERSSAPSGELISIDLGTGAVNAVATPMPPLARDFSFDSLSGTIWFAGARPARAEDNGGVADQGIVANQGDARYALYGFDTATAHLSVVVAGDSLAFLPRAWPGDHVAFRCQDGSNALCLANNPGGAGRGRASGAIAHLIGAASTPGEVQLAACTDVGDVAFGVRPGRGRSFPTPFRWMVGDPAPDDVTLPAGQVIFIGVVELPVPLSAVTLPALAPAAQ